MNTSRSFAVGPARRFAGRLRVPGDKGISHRALLLGSGCRGRLKINGLSSARDVISTLTAVRRLKPGHEHQPNPLVETLADSSKTLVSLELEGSPAWTDWPAVNQIDCENSGTTMRLLMGVLSGRPSGVELTGDPSLSARPMGRVADPLRLMGADIRLSPAGTPPVEVRGGTLQGIRYELPVASAQVKSAVLLAGLQAAGTTTVVEPRPTRDHTERMLAYLGAGVRREGSAISVERTDLFGDKEIDIPGDFSSASFLLTAAAIHPDGEVEIVDVGLNPTRTAFLSVLERFGAAVEVRESSGSSWEPRGSIRLRAGERRPVWVGPDEIPACIDELPLVAVLAAVAEGRSEIRGAAELRVKESDRIEAIAAGLRAMGARIEALPDGFEVRGPSALNGAEVDSRGDHRIAMALAVAATAARGETIVHGWQAVGVSYPEFPSHLAELTA